MIHTRCDLLAEAPTFPQFDDPLGESLLNQPAKREAAAKRHPLQRIGEPGYVASAVRFLLTEDSNWITGQVLAVDGGLSRIRSLS